MSQIQKLVVVKNAIDSQTMKFASIDQELAGMKEYMVTHMPMFAKFDKMANEWSPQVEAMLAKHDDGHKVAMAEHVATLAKLQNLHDITHKTLSETNAKVLNLESRGVGSSSDAAGREKFDKKYEMTRPKDMEPSVYSGKDEEWSQWKEGIEDYLDIVHPSLKAAMTAMAKQKSEIIEHSLTSHDPPFGREEWALSEKLFVLLKRKTSIEARNVVMCVERQNGFEA